MSQAPKRTPIRFMILSGFLLASMAVAAASYMAYLGVDGLAGSLRRSVQPDIQLKTLQELVKTISQAESGVRAFAITQDQKSLVPFYEAIEQIDEKLDTLTHLSEEVYLMDSVNTLVEEKFIILKEIVAIIDSGIGISAFDKLYAEVMKLPPDTVWKPVKEAVIIPKNQETDSEKLSETEEKIIEESPEESVEEVKRGKKKRDKKANGRNNIFKKIFGGGKKKKQEEEAKAIELAIAKADSTVSSPDTQWVETQQAEVRSTQSHLKQLQRSARAFDKEEANLLKEQARQVMRYTVQDQLIMTELTTLLKELERRQNSLASTRAERALEEASRTTRNIAIFGSVGLVLVVFLLIVIFRYISTSRRLQERLLMEKRRAEKLARAKEEFLSNMSHEIRTPMNAVIGFTEQLAGTPLNSRQKNYLQTIGNSADHLLALLNDILDYSKLESGSFDMERIAFPLNSLMGEAQNTFSHAARKKEIDLKLDLDPDLPKVIWGDPLRLKQMIFNLLSNAIKFTDEGEVELSCKLNEAAAGELIIQVTDTGVGIPEDKLEAVFADFQQASSSVSRHFGGTGLGLSITRKLVELHHGNIELVSEEGKGTSISLVLPFEEAEMEDVEVSEPIQIGATSGFAHLKALVADDEAYNRQLVQAILEKWKIKVDLVENGQQAVDKLKQNKYDMLLMDFRMPVKGGLEATKEIRSGIDGEIPIIGLTATSTQKEIEECLEAGMNAHLLKPFKETELFQLLANLLGIESSAGPLEETEVNSTNYSQAYQLQELFSLGNNDKKFVIKMLKLFVENTTGHLEGMKTSLDKNDWEEISMFAHKMIPPCRHLGLDSLATELFEIEKKARNSEDLAYLPRQITDAVSELRSILQSVNNDINQLENFSEPL